MNWFKNLNTITKLMISFGLQSVAIGMVAYLGISGVDRVNSMLNKLYEKDLVGLSEIKTAQVELALIGRAARQAIIDTDMELMKASWQRIQESMGRFNTAIANAEKSFDSPEGKTIVSKLKDTSRQYFPLVESTVKLTMANNNREAVQEMARARQIADATSQIMNEAVDLKQRLAKEAYVESDAIVATIRSNAIMVSGLALVGAFILGFLIAKMITTPLQEIVSVAKELSKGNFDQQVRHESRDEVGLVAAAFREMIINVTTPLRDISSVLSRLAERDLLARMTGEAVGDFAPIKESLNRAAENLNEALIEVRESAEQVASTSQQLSASSEEISSGAQEQAASLEETSATLEEISSTVKQNAENARHANQLAAGAREAAEKGGEVVGSAVSAMSEINSASARIAEIITTIDEIAFQTNLLALNAAVEAARAGEQGRGFAVVASEVRTLAQRSATAAKEIKRLIEDSVKKVQTGSELVNRSGQTLSEIVASVKRVTDIVAEIAAGSMEQSTGVEQVAKATAQLDQVTQANASQTEEMSATSTQLASTADRLQELVGQFSLSSGSDTRRHKPVVRQVAPPKKQTRPNATAKVIPRLPLSEQTGAQLVALNHGASEKGFGEF